ncbi:KRAB [Lepeophtheirus salmonis]|uniref:KRAB n=1 Tax=Lepeophtheirus salmonis TaxID=72036 RepID=A0A7R8H9E3_LEPSM|nr:KRAB [Lepeophtheirus salmonis]CAF2957191.1 KRAB [Lepeophtheirus salmonis]
MPDHHRTKASSNAFDSPLSLVVAHEDRLKEEEKNHGSSPGRSSGFSDGSGDENYHRQRLASEGIYLCHWWYEVLGEIESYDSGHEEDHHPHAHHRVILEEPDDFAKLLCEKSEDNALSSEVHSEYSSYEEVHPQAWNGSSGSLSGKESFPCEFCDKIFHQQVPFTVSSRDSYWGEKFECRKCHKTFGRKSTLRAHMTTHTKVSNFMCPICDKACNDNNSLEEHIRMHTGEKTLFHTGERPFVCLNCRKDFTEKRFLNDHIQTAHSGQDGPLKCPNCFREFAYKTSLKQHLKKQMCVKNLSRTGNLANNNGGNNNSNSNNNNNFINNGSPNISCNFPVPFVKKATAGNKHLNSMFPCITVIKFHTDEFWKYELTKHRRAVVDSKTNEDMWKKQLGKHGSEQKADNTASNEMWLEQN